MKNQSGSILIVDDEFSVRDSLEGWFRKDGYRTGTAESGEAALERLQEASWDVVLVDIKMPGMDGLEATRKILAADETAKVVVLSTYEAAEYEQLALDAGAVAFISKSEFGPDELLAAWDAGA